MNDKLNHWRRPALTLFLGVVLTGGLVGCGDGNTKPAEVAESEAAAGDEHAGETDVLVLDSVGVSAAGIEVGTAATVTTTGLPVTGTITYDANRVSHVGPKTQGRIAALRADLGSRVRPGQALALLESADVGSLRTTLTESEALLAIARENHARERRLEEQGISSRKELLEAERELRRAEAAARSSRERLRILGASGGRGGSFAVAAPFAGTVVEKHAGLGEVVGPDAQLFTVADLGTVWIELDIFERDLARVSAGQTVDVTVAAYPGRVFPGRIVYVGDVLDIAKRTVGARVEVPNPGRVLKPGMFATALIQVGGGGTPMVVIPQDAVQELGGRKVVFVPGDQPGEFRATPVQVGEIADEGRVTILSGLAPGDRVVIAGAFALRSELAKGEIGEHGH